MIDQIQPARDQKKKNCKRPYRNPIPVKGPRQEFNMVPKPGRKMSRQRQKYAIAGEVRLIALSGQHISRIDLI